MQVGIISLFPEMFDSLGSGITGRAIDNKLVELYRWQLRDFCEDKHRTVDDRPYGGGPGMVMMAPPLARAITHAKRELPKAKVAFLSPKGNPFKQQDAEKLAKREQVIFLAGRYEGVDQRLLDNYVDEQWSIGDYVLSGGELGIMVMLDAIIRLLPGALGHELSAVEDSFSNGILDHPHFTRPDEFEGDIVPRVLQGGNHAEIAKFRRQQALGLTWQQRPDLLNKIELSAEDQSLLNAFQQKKKQ